MPDTRHRTTEPEIMDDFSLEGEELRDALDKIAKINRILGGNRLTLEGVGKLLSDREDAELTIVDVGCGNGDMLRALSKFMNDYGIGCKLIGIDANKFTINHARNLSVHYPEISYICQDIFDDGFRKLEYDIVLCTLTLHHFSDSEIIALMRIFSKNARIGIVVNDLHRSKVAYWLFGIMCFLFRLNRMSKQDGLVSILRGFKKEDLKRYSTELGITQYRIRWRWAFRYEWIIKKI